MSDTKKRKFHYTIPGMYEYDELILYDTTPRWLVEQVKNLKFRKDDILVVTYCKSGKSSDTFYFTFSKIRYKCCLSRRGSLCGAVYCCLPGTWGLL